MKQKLLTILALMCLTVTNAVAQAFDRGFCGATGYETAVTWELTGDAGNYTLTISGALAAPPFFAFNETTGIEMPTAEATDADTVVYDLQGRRVAKPTRGLYIVNGRKVFIK